MPELVRIQKFLSAQGLYSRRAAEDLISRGLIMLNNQKVKLGDKIDPDKDILKIKGRLYKYDNKHQFVYIALNKPTGYICSTTNKQGRSVLDLLPAKLKKQYGHIYPIGRLDKDSQGLLILTNDGELANQLSHPRYKHQKEYEILITQRLNPFDKQKLEKGLRLKGVFYGGLKITGVKRQSDFYLVNLILHQGKNRQIRKMFGQLGYNLTSLNRTRINKLKLKNLKTGEYKIIEKNDII